MSAAPKLNNLDDFAAHAREAYERLVKPKLRPEDHGKFVVLDPESGDFEIDERDMDAILRLRARLPKAKAWIERVGYPSVHRFYR